jgi:hypothetical protein
MGVVAPAIPPTPAEGGSDNLLEGGGGEVELGQHRPAARLALTDNLGGGKPVRVPDQRVCTRVPKTESSRRSSRAR